MRAFFLLTLGVAYADTAAPSPAPTSCPTAGFEGELGKAKKNVAAVKAEADSLARLGSGADDACRVALFKLYWKFYASVQEAMMPSSTDEKQKKKIEKQIKPLGWVLVGGEAGDSIQDGSDWLVKHAGPSLPPDWRSFLANDNQDTREGFQEDGGLTISWMQLRQRIRRWEDFLAAYPKFSDAEDVKKRVRYLLIAFLGGLDNTPSFDRETNQWDPEARREVEAYLADKKAQNKKLVRGYHQILKKNDFLYTDAVQKYLDDNHLRFGE